MRRSFVFLLSLLVIILFYSFVVIPFGERHEEIVDELQIKSRTLGNYKVILDNAAETEEDIGLVNEKFEKISTTLINAKNDAIGVARLNSHIQGIIKKSGLEIISIRPLNVVKYKLYVGMPMQINAKADVKQLKDFLRYLSSGKYLVSIDTINIRVMNIRKPDKIRLKIDISGFREI